MNINLGSTTLTAEVQKIVGSYIGTLLSCKSRPSDASELPYSKTTIKLALIAMIAVIQDAKAREYLISVFVQLADWQEGIGPGPHSVVDVFGGTDLLEEARRIGDAAPSMMKTGERVIAEMKALIDELKSLGMYT